MAREQTEQVNGKDGSQVCLFIQYSTKCSADFISTLWGHQSRKRGPSIRQPVAENHKVSIGRISVQGQKSRTWTTEGNLGRVNCLQEVLSGAESKLGAQVYWLIFTLFTVKWPSLRPWLEFTNLKIIQIFHTATTLSAAIQASSWPAKWSGFPYWALEMTLPNSLTGTVKLGWQYLA